MFQFIVKAVNYAKIRKLTYEQRFAISLGQKIKQRRKSLGYTQKKLTALVQEHPGGLSLYRELLCRIELGQTMPSVIVLLILTEKLDVKLEYWFQDLEAELE
jgi:transcriptional regulator with XRE-family HTH domain